MSVIVIALSRSSELKLRAEGVAINEREAKQYCPRYSEGYSGVRQKSHLDSTSVIPRNHRVLCDDKKSGKVELVG